MPEKLVSVTDARATLSRLIAMLCEDGDRAEPVFIGKHGEAAAVLLSVERFHEYRALLALRRHQLGIPAQVTDVPRAPLPSPAPVAAPVTPPPPVLAPSSPPPPPVRVIGPYHTKPHQPGDFRGARGA